MSPRTSTVAKPKPKKKSGAAKPGSRKKEARLGLLKKASAKVAKAAARLVKSASKSSSKASSHRAGKPAAKHPARPASKPASAPIALRTPEKPRPRATKLPPVGEPLTKRELEQILTAAAGRGVAGEGSLKGRLVVKDGMPYLHVVGRDKRELVFLLQGPDQEVLPAYVDHKVSVSGLIKKTHNYGGTVDVRKYAAKRPDAEPAETPVVEKLRYLSPGELEQIAAAGMGAGMKGFGTLRGNLEMTGEEFFLVVSNAGTRQQVSFLLQGRGAKGLRKNVGQVLQVTGVVEKSSGWGGTMQLESFEPRLMDHRSISRENLEIVKVEGPTSEGETVEARLNHGLAVRLPERPGFTWAIEPTTAKRMGLREANYEPPGDGPARREFFFTPRNPGAFEIDFFLAKAFNPAQVSKTFKLGVVVKP